MYDVLILVSEQKKAIYLNMDDIVLLPMNKKSTDRKKFYFEIWPYINNVSGILYKIFTKRGFGEFECGDDLFDFDYSQNIPQNQCVPYFFSNDFDMIKDDLDSLSINSLYKKTFFDIMRLLISKSPIHTLIFLCRGQSNEKEILLGKISLDNFFELLMNGQVFTNVCYIIGE